MTIAEAPSGARPRYILMLLVAMMLVNNMDRYIMAILLQPIKADLHLTDLQIGILTGFAFTAFYATASIPIARLADRGYRHRVIWLSLATWGLLTASCGLAQNFIQLMLSRFGVGAAEAGASPAAQSMVADLFPPARRNGAMALLQGGGSIGLLLAFSLGGILESVVGWRTTFALVSLPALLLATLIVLTIPDWQRRADIQFARARFPSGQASFAGLLSNRFFLLLCLSAGFLMILLLGLPQWLPAFIERSHGLERSTIGGFVALTTGLGMLVGIVSGGAIADRLARRNPLWPARLMLGSVILAAVPLPALFLSNNIGVVFTMMALSGFLVAVPAGLLTAMTQSVVSNGQRASAAAVFIFCSSMIGTGLGPLVIGALSDLYQARTGQDSLRWALLTVVMIDCPLLIGAFARVHQLQRRRLRTDAGAATDASEGESGRASAAARA